MIDPDQDRLKDNGFEPVHVELEWYDRPRAGLADIDGAPHYFRAVHDYAHAGEPDDEHFVWPASETSLTWEREQWAIFVEWNRRHEAGTATPDSHPGHGGIDARYDELTTLLASHRAMPEDARRLRAEWRWSSSPTRYHAGGLDYRVRWRPI